MTSTWVVVADSGSARIFTADSATGPLVEKEDYAHPEARVAERTLASDRPGRTVDSSGRRHAFSGEESPRRHEANAFAKLLGKRLAGARAKHEFDHLVLVAAPAFLGMLRGSLDAETRKCVESELSLDLVSFRPEEIRTRLPEMLFEGAETH